jgi:hypothetical protein
MATPIAVSLEQLCGAFMDKGCEADRYLRPGMTAEAVAETTQGLPLTPPSEIVELYGWHDGQDAEAEFEPGAFRFRDQVFCSLERGVEGREKILNTYGGFGFADDFGFDIEQALPFATSEGSWYAVICGPHRLASPAPHPVVSFFQGVDLYFHSFESMLATCIDWVRSPE